MCLHALWEAGPSQSASHELTFFDNIDNVIGIEAEFICVLSIIGIQSLALWHLRLRLGLGLGSAPCWGRPAGCLSPDSVEREEAGEMWHPTGGGSTAWWFGPWGQHWSAQVQIQLHP